MEPSVTCVKTSLVTAAIYAIAHPKDQIDPRPATILEIIDCDHPIGAIASHRSSPLNRLNVIIARTPLTA